jgi:hypothetical protein
MAGDETLEHVAEVRKGLDVVELGGLNQRRHDSPTARSAIPSGEERVPSGQYQGPDLPLDGVCVELDAAVVEETGQALPAGERVAHGFGKLTLTGDAAKLLLQPRLERLDEGTALFLANELAFLGGLTMDLGLDGIECGDALQCLGGDRRAGRFLHVEEPAAKMRPAMCENDVAVLALDASRSKPWKASTCSTPLNLAR